MDRHSDIATVASGSSEGGFIVDMHDGENHAVHISHADTADGAVEEGLRHFPSRDRRPADGDRSFPDHKDIEAMREEIANLKNSVSRLESNVADLVKNREGVRTEQDRHHAEEMRELQSRVDTTNATIEHHLDAGSDRAVERDAHGQDVRDPARVQTAATGEAAEAEHHG